MKNLNLEQILLDQKYVANKYHIDIDSPDLNQLCIIHPMIYDKSIDVIGVRYKNDNSKHMSGWWIVPCDESIYNRDELVPVHTFHIYEGRDDVAHFMGLPAGYTFDTSNNSSSFEQEYLENNF